MKGEAIPTVVFTMGVEIGLLKASQRLGKRRVSPLFCGLKK
jgi:hypothetical protein